MKNHKFIPQLDGLRACAILAVLMAHFSFDFRDIRLFDWLSRYGSLGVEIFFVLSGYLITGILIKNKNSENYFRSFFARRGLRIWPLYYLVLVFLYMSALLPQEQWRDWRDYALYIENLTGTGAHAPGPLLPMWSLAVEEQFYLVWPFVVLILPVRLVRYFACALVTTVPVLRMLLPLNTHNTLFQLDALGLGALTACIDVKSARMQWLASRGIWLFILGILGELIPESQRSLHQVVLTLQVFGSGALLLVTLRDTGLVVRMLRNPIMIYTGRVSYGIYVLHMLVSAPLRKMHIYSSIIADRSITKDIFLMLVESVVTIVAATLSFYFFENHFLKLKRYFEPKPKKIASTPSVSVSLS